MTDEPNNKPTHYVQLDKTMVKEALKEGVKEWMDERFRDVGRWTARSFLIALFGVLVYLILSFAGWRPPNGRLPP